MTQPEAIPASPRIHRLKLYYEQHEAKLAIAFFVGGFLFDILTLGRVDSWLTIGQQILYLVVITTALMQMFFDQGRPPPALEDMFVVKRWYYEYRTALVHFFLGTLLSLNTIFFFKSSSLLVSFAFMLCLVGSAGCQRVQSPEGAGAVVQVRPVEPVRAVLLRAASSRCSSARSAWSCSCSRC